MSLLRSRWAAVGAAVAVTLGAGGIGIVDATLSTGERTAFVPIAPCRLFDTRPAPDTVGLKGTPLGPSETYTVAVRGNNGQCSGIPADAVGVSLNVTALNATNPTFVTVFAADATRPLASSLNPVPGAPPTPNAVVSDLSASGMVSLYNQNGHVDVFADVVGYYVDHNHDDRYVRLPETEYIVNPATWQPATDTTEWNFGFLWTHGASVGNECLFAPLQVPEGRTITRLVANYVSNNVVDPLQISLAGVRHGSGPSTGLSHAPNPPIPNLMAAATGVTAIGEIAATVPPGFTTQAGYSYAARLCVQDAMILTGFEVEFA